MSSFAHLHVHSEYSLLDGLARTKELVAAAKSMGMEAIAITDHGVMYGVVEFYKEAKKAGIKPILGCEVYVASGSRFDREQRDSRHLVLLAKTNKGYQNLIKLVSLGFTEGFYYKPRVDVDLLRIYNEGIIALSACISGVVADVVINEGYNMGKEEALLYRGIFGEDFYLELQDYGSPEQIKMNEDLIRLSTETGIPLVATNDVHYISRQDATPHEVLLCIQTGKTMQDENRMSFGSSEFYLKSPEEMQKLFSHVPEAIGNTAKIAGMCDVALTFNEYKLPVFESPKGKSDAEYLRELCEQGLAERYKNEVLTEYKKRLDFELEVITRMGFVTYFLVVWDFIRYAREEKIMVGPGRGSGAGSIVAYTLRITDVDPIPFNLLFERFLNPERVSMPDFDIDFCYLRRQEVIDYVTKKYGADHVAQIITFGTMKARAATRDVGRALGFSYADVDRVAKMIPTELGMTLTRALEINPELKNAYANEDDTKRLIDMSLKLEGIHRHASTHAAGVVISDKPVSEYVPLNVNDGVVTTQFSMKTIEELGLLKMDFLGLRTLTVIRMAAEEVKRAKGVLLDVWNWQYGYDDPKIFEMISSGRTAGVFQLESSGMTSFMRDMQPTCIEDMTARISLFRPGPMDYIPQYIKGKKEPRKVKYMHPSLEPILKATYGCMVYQEQVMQIVRDLAGYSLARSDLIRRAMSKKEDDVMARERHNFIHGSEKEGVPGCVKNGIPEKIASQIFDAMEKFAAYAFNKPHAVGYAVVGYQTAWLKYYYPVEFMAALMSSVMDSSSKVAMYIRECKKMGINLLPPDVNEGYANFSVWEGNIRFGLSSIKNVGRNTVEALVAERGKGGRYKTLTEFIRRLSTYDINKRCLESLIRSGAFDTLGGRRSQYVLLYPIVQNSLGHLKKTVVRDQLSLFDFGDTPSNAELDVDELPEVPDFPEALKLSDEKELLGVYVSGHPLSKYEETLKHHTTCTSIDFETEETDESEGPEQNNSLDGKIVKYGGLITAKSVKYTKADNKAFCFLTVEDMYGTVEVAVFSKMYENIGTRLAVDEVIVVQGRVSAKEDEAAKLIASEVLFYNEMAEAVKQQTVKTKTSNEKPRVAIPKTANTKPQTTNPEATSMNKQTAMPETTNHESLTSSSETTSRNGQTAKPESINHDFLAGSSEATSKNKQTVKPEALNHDSIAASTEAANKKKQTAKPEALNHDFLTASSEATSKEKQTAKPEAINEKQQISKPEAPSDETNKINILWLKIPASMNINPSNITDILSSHKGQTVVKIYSEKDNSTYQAPKQFWVEPSQELHEKLADLLGNETVRLVKS